ncbi:MAG: ATP-dependent zinc metalloprotease FtsH [Gammaproteobacteria bacterium]|nr:ATP-dependent zinc metalloprotease FtsH [Gammaproteobacteria bacterium]
MKSYTKWLPFILLLALGFYFYFSSLDDNRTDSSQKPVTVSYSAFKKLLSAGEIQHILFEGQRAHITLKRPIPVGEKQIASTALVSFLPPLENPDLLQTIHAQQVEIESRPAPQSGNAWLSLLPWLLLLGFYWWIWRRQMGGAAGGRPDITGFLGPGNKKTDELPDIRFDDVAGQDNAKNEISELVDFLRDPERYARLGAEAPRGVLMMGPPGTGKTLLAKALAGEAGVPFFNISASEFIELYVGVGAARVRSMFADAKQKAPSIIFIDEIDSVGRVRGTGLGGGHDEREQTLNQILAEMDGFSGHEAVIVLAATNRPDVLDPALLRPGRFDRHVTLELPDKNAREAILRVHTRKIPLAENVDLSVVAAGTPGFSGADLKNLVNEAAMMAVRKGTADVEMKHLEDMRDKVLIGSVRTLAIQPEERHRLAVHESGHTAVSYFLPNADPLYKVSIIPRGQALGVTQSLPVQERHTLPEDYLRDRLPVMLGGRAAEVIFLGNCSSGADDDIKQATQLARAMISRWGMSKAIGPLEVRDSESHPFLGREMAQSKHYSESTASRVDQEVSKLLKAAEARAIQIMQDHKSQINTRIVELEQKETLDHDQIEHCLQSVSDQQIG